jgi:hypothetical protein
VTGIVPSRFRNALLRRSAGLWLLLRVAIVTIGLLVEVPLPELVFLTVPAAGFVGLLVAWLTLFDARRRGETLWLADLGVAPAALLAIALAPPLVAELGVRAAAAW